MAKITGPPDSTQEREPERPIKVDFTNPADQCPFRKAEKTEKRLKLFLWGPSGSGKTTLALRFPKPAVIDLERGTEHYAEDFCFEVLPATTPQEIEGAIDWLLANNHDYRTLVIDPITIYWEALQKHWSDTFLKRNKGSKGYKFEFYELQPKDWNTIKSELKETLRKLLALDMHVIVTARSKTLYEEGTFMKAAGETWDGEKSLPYMFDTVLKLNNEGGKFFATNLKDRTNKLPKGTFEVSYELFETTFGARQIARKAAPIRLATQGQKEKVLQLAKECGMTQEQIDSRLESYGAESIDDLTKTNAEIILEKLEAVIAGKKGIQTQTGENPQGKGNEDAKN